MKYGPYNETFRVLLQPEQVFVVVQKMTHIQQTHVCYKTNKHYIFSQCSETNIKYLILKAKKLLLFQFEKKITT